MVDEKNPVMSLENEDEEVANSSTHPFALCTLGTEKARSDLDSLLNYFIHAQVSEILTESNYLHELINEHYLKQTSEICDRIDNLLMIYAEVFSTEISIKLVRIRAFEKNYVFLIPGRSATKKEQVSRLRLSLTLFASREGAIRKVFNKNVQLMLTLFLNELKYDIKKRADAFQKKLSLRIDDYITAIIQHIETFQFMLKLLVPAAPALIREVVEDASQLITDFGHAESCRIGEQREAVNQMFLKAVREQNSSVKTILQSKFGMVECLTYNRIKTTRDRMMEAIEQFIEAPPSTSTTGLGKIYKK